MPVVSCCNYLPPNDWTQPPAHLPVSHISAWLQTMWHEADQILWNTTESNLKAYGTSCLLASLPVLYTYLINSRYIMIVCVELLMCRNAVPYADRRTIRQDSLKVGGGMTGLEEWCLWHLPSCRYRAGQSGTSDRPNPLFGEMEKTSLYTVSVPN